GESERALEKHVVDPVKRKRTREQAPAPARRVRECGRDASCAAAAGRDAIVAANDYIWIT
ncbi:hypothetical protein AAHH80_34765, partial [Burkholderia pseudomallei]